MKRRIVPLFLSLAFVTAVQAADPTIGEAAPDFQCKTVEGAEVQLKEYRGKTVVLEWTNYDCPFVRKHYSTKNMQNLQKEYTERGVVWITICSSAPGKQGNYPADKWPEMMEKRGASPTALVLDVEGTIGRLYDAKTTPHMFVVAADGALVYNGAIDDNRSWDPKTVDGANNYVRAALEAVLKGEKPEVSETKPYGCSVKY